jgi:hypothetical protein
MRKLIPLIALVACVTGGSGGTDAGASCGANVHRHGAGAWRVHRERRGTVIHSSLRGLTMLKPGGSPMAIPEDRQQAKLRETDQIIT